VDEDGLFWPINYFSTSDRKLIPAEDKIALAFGVGASHQDSSQIERLIALRISSDYIQVISLSTIYLELTGEESNIREGGAHGSGLPPGDG
jgi:hypothetical protein